MTQLPSDSKAWPKAGADDKAVASGEQINGSPGGGASSKKTGTGSDLPAAVDAPQASEAGSAFPEAHRKEGETDKPATRDGGA